MKNLLPFTFLIFFIPAIAQWKTAHTATGQNSIVRKIQFINSGTAYAVGDSALLKSTDGGETWADITANITATYPSFRTLFFVDESVGFIGRPNITGGPTLLKTINGGNTWTDVSSSIMSQGVSDLFFVSPDIGYATGGVGAGNVFARTIDGGKNWTKVQTPAIETAVTMHFINDLTGFSGTNQIMKTTDGGQSWLPVVMPALSSANAISDFVFMNNSVGYALTNGGNVVLKTIDGGNTWTAKSTGTGGIFSFDIGFTNAGTGFLILNYNSVYITQNGGDTWNKDTTLPAGSHPACLAAIAGRVLVGTIDGNILLRKSSSAGITGIDEEHISIYPNPVNTGTLHFNNPARQKLGVKIYDAAGRLVITENNVTDKINISLAPAVYYCHIQGAEAGTSYMQKLVVQ